MKILAIDTSCDETAVAVIEDDKILSNSISSQVQFHKAWGGVVPSLAQRMHKEKFPHVLGHALRQAHININDIDAFAVTYGPGLAIALEVGIDQAKKLALTHGKPLYGISHMEGHIYSIFAKNSHGAGGEVLQVGFPLLALLISGGHTELVIMHGHGHYVKIGEKLDDAIGEAYDKVGRMLEIGYPGGIIIEKFARLGNINTYPLPIPLHNKDSYDFSYSGLKTAVSRYVQEAKAKNTFTKETIYDLAASFQYAATQELYEKTNLALQRYPVKALLVGGGVSANIYIRAKLRTLAKTYTIPVFYPTPKRLCGDNAGMVGICAYWRIKTNTIKPVQIEGLERVPRLDINPL